MLSRYLNVIIIRNLTQLIYFKQIRKLRISVRLKIHIYFSYLLFYYVLGNHTQWSVMVRHCLNHFPSCPNDDVTSLSSTWLPSLAYVPALHCPIPAKWWKHVRIKIVYKCSELVLRQGHYDLYHGAGRMIKPGPCREHVGHFKIFSSIQNLL